MIEKRRCNECGADIAVTYTRNDLYFFIEDDGEIKRDENVDIQNPEGFTIHCSEDREHICEPEKNIDDFEFWKHTLLSKIIEKYGRYFNDSST